MTSTWPILSVLIWLPIIGGIVVAFGGANRPALARLMALIISVVTFLLSIMLFTGFDTGTAAMQFTELHPWIPAFDIN